jgi:hypothetical protein
MARNNEESVGAEWKARLLIHIEVERIREEVSWADLK